MTWQVSPDLLGVLNADGYFETSNPAWRTVLGWSEAEVASQSIFELLHPDDVERTRLGFALTQIGQPAIRFPNRYRCKDGSYRWISWVGILEDRLVYCSGRDITDEKAAGEKLANAQEVLRQSQKMEAIGNLSGGMSHDFNNMLGVIIGSLDLAVPLVKDNHEVAELVEEALSAAVSSAELNSRLLAFARRQSLRPERILPNELISSIIRLLRRTLGENIEIVLDLASDLWPIIADSAQL